MPKGRRGRGRLGIAEQEEQDHLSDQRSKRFRRRPPVDMAVSDGDLRPRRKRPAGEGSEL